MQYVATINVPGYMPDDMEPAVFDTARDAWQYLVGEVDQAWDYYAGDDNGACLEAHTALHNIDQNRPGVVYAPTPGYYGDHDLGLAYSVDVFEGEL